MFSGIVQQLGAVKKIIVRDNIKTFYIVFGNCNQCNIGDSIAINGTCLTITGFNLKLDMASFDAMPETLKKTTLSNLNVADNVNIEFAINYGSPVGGHMVQGHIDEKGYIKNIKHVGSSCLIEISASKEFLEYLIPKGFVSIDGMSITVVDILDDGFSVALVPHTVDVTIAKKYTNGFAVNLEADATGKYIYKYVQRLRDV